MVTVALNTSAPKEMTPTPTGRRRFKPRADATNVEREPRGCRGRCPGHLAGGGAWPRALDTHLRGDRDVPILRAVVDPGTRLPKLTLPAEGPSASVSSPSVAARGRQQEDVEKCECAVSLWNDVRPREINS